jgi:hypothetical protein
MSTRRVLAGLGALALIGGLAACGSTRAQVPAAVPTVQVTQTVTATPTPTPMPTPTVTKIVVPVPATTVYVAPAAPALAACGSGTQGEEVYAGPDTSCPFALNVEQAWSQSGATSTFYAYSPVTGSSYLMTSSVSGGLVSVTGGNNALVEFTP